MGSTNFRRSALSDHTKSKDHVDAIRAEQDPKDAAPIFSSASDLADKAMLSLIQTTYFIAKEDVAILKFKELTDLLEQCECPHLPQALYRNRDGCHKMITIIGDYLESQLVTIVHSSGS